MTTVLKGFVRRKLGWMCILLLGGQVVLGLKAPALLGGSFSGQPEEMEAHLGTVAQDLIKRAFADMGAEPLEDYHAHLIGIGTGDSHAEVNPDMMTWWHAVRRMKTSIFLSACGVSDLKRLDQEYVERLMRLMRGFRHPLKLHLLAMDHFYYPDGRADPSKIDFYVPNEDVVRLAGRYPEYFIPVISIHPDRPGAVSELEKWAKQGVRYVKWLPNAQGIDPSLARYDAFYEVMRKYGLILLTHTGMERSVDSSAQAFGNPLLLRRPLDHGVKVIMAHCASSGRNADLDHPGTVADNFDLFLRMMATGKYRGLLFADISATTQVNRTPRPILEMMRHPEWHDRLVNGSDYPIPTLNCVIWTSKLARLGMITSEERRGLNEIYSYNPLLFDYVLKRTLRDPQTGRRLPAGIFAANPGLKAL